MTIYHIVLIKFTEVATPAQKQAWKDGITALSSSIPHIQEIVSGTRLPHVRDGGWDDGVIMKFKDEDDLKAYVDAAPHREYQAATAEQTAGRRAYSYYELLGQQSLIKK